MDNRSDDDIIKKTKTIMNNGANNDDETGGEIGDIIRNSSAERPESLSMDNVVKMLNEKGIKPEKPVKATNNHAKMRAALSIAAAFCVLIAAVSIGGSLRRNERAQVNDGSSEQNEIPSDATTAATQQSAADLPAGVSQASYDKLQDYFLSVYKEYESKTWINFGMAGASKDMLDSADGESAAVSAAATGTAASDTAFGKTNTQIDGVDEADLIKNDGKYLYTVNTQNIVSIVDPQGMSVVSSIEVEDNKSEDNDVLNISNMYLSGNTLVIVCNSYDSSYSYNMLDGLYCNCRYFGGNGDTVTIIYDITDRASPVEKRRFTQDGSQISSRMVGSVIYNVTQYNVDFLNEKTVKENCIPTADGVRIDAECIYWDENTVAQNQDSVYTLLTAFDTAQPDSEVASLASLGTGDEVFCTQSALFIAGEKWQNDSSNTVITEYTLSGTTLAYKAQGSVPGICLNQFSMDEHAGYFRIATTSYDYSDYVDRANVYVLDGEMKIVGKLEDLAYDESIRSVRFIGDTAYVVTFLNTDPLFVIDLSEPTAPKVLGEVKLPGFSAYLHPVGDKLIVGVGYDGNDKGADYCTVKVSLFDVSDPTKPIEVNNVVVKDANTMVNDDPKAFMYYPEEKLVGIPLEILKDYGESVKSFMLLKIEDGKLVKLNGFIHGKVSAYSFGAGYFRGTYIGDSLYTLTPSVINRFNMSSFEKTGTLEIAAAEQEYDVTISGAEGDATEAVSTETQSASAVPATTAAE